MRPVYVAILALILGGLAGCGSGQAALNTPVAKPPVVTTEPVETTVTPQAIGECFYSATAYVYADEDGDGQPDPGEAPLPDIRLMVVRTNPNDKLYEGKTGPDGKAEFGAISNLCDWENYRVMIIAPEGRQFSTRSTATFAEVDNGGSVNFGLQPAPERTAIPSPSPTAEVSPTAGAAFGACDVMSKQQAGAILGELSGDPFELEYIGPGPELIGLCVFPGKLNTASTELYRFQSEAAARAHFEEFTGGGGEAVDGIADEALWDEGYIRLAVRRGTVTLYISMDTLGSARDQAIQIAQIAVVRVP